MSAPKVTPMMEQFLKVKAEYPDALVFYRMGEFYEMFGPDAVTGAAILEIALTSRDKKKKDGLPMCGIPAHSWENYANKLTKAGHKVAICDQLEDPSQSKGLVKRGVVKVITPGTVLSSQLLDEKSNRFIAAIYADEKTKRLGLAFADLTTGEFEFDEADLTKAALSFTERMQGYQPVEVLYPDRQEDEALYKNLLSDITGGIYQKPHLEAFDGYSFGLSEAERSLKDHFELQSLDVFGLEKSSEALKACGGLLGYLKATQKDALRHVTQIKACPKKGVMALDGSTIRNLELFEPLQTSLEDHSLIQLLDKTKTPMGARLLKKWLLHPLMEQTRIERRYEAIGYLVKENWKGSSLRKSLSSINDLERIIARLALPNANLHDLLRLRNGVEPLAEIQAQVIQLENAGLQELVGEFDPLLDLFALLESHIMEQPNLKAGDGGFINHGISAELDELRSLTQNSKQHLANLEASEKQRTGITSLKVGYNRVFGYFIEISNASKHLAPEDYIRKQTLTNGERYITDELKELEEKIITAQDEAIKIETALLEDLLNRIKAQINRVQKTAKGVALLDVLAGLANIAVTNNYVRPELNTVNQLEIIGGRHPVIETLFPDDPFVSNDLILDQSRDYISVITGPNMGGKSTYMRQAALICLMAQIGSFVPAKSAKLPIFDRIFTRVGASDNLARGQSTFMVEMNEAASILNNATANSFVILDEIGRGTSTFDGISIAWAILEHLHKKKSLTLFATHYHELILLEEELDGVFNEKVTVEEAGEGIVFLRKVVAGKADKSYGIQVASLAGLPFEVVMRAKGILTELEKAEDNLKSTRKKAIKDSSNQQITFAPIEARWVGELREFDLNSHTPLQAMEFLYKIKEQLK
ncbi:MAG: DNA mismatch repair protein MutS [SAR324 cluster bacterium]|nr:DNA mismatch repair protein MutS [SAR324 cluster bacterium]